MKKTIIMLTAIAMIFTMLTGVSAFASELPLTPGQHNQQIFDKYERTDEYALDYFKNKNIFRDKDMVEVIKTAQKVTEGLTDDYAKAKAIFYWVADNIHYDIDARFATWNTYAVAREVLQYKRTVCEGFADLTVAMAQAVGLPAKKIYGTLGSILGTGEHAWTEIYAGGRWITMDASSGSSKGYVDGQYLDYGYSVKDEYFDMNLGVKTQPKKYNGAYTIHESDFVNQEARAWKGTLTFFDITGFGKDVKVIENFPVNGLVDSTYGFDINTLFLDNQCTQPFKLNTMRVDSVNNVIIVNPAKATTPAPAPAKTVTAKPTVSKVIVNGKTVEFDAYNINGNNFFKLRDLAQAVNGTKKNFEVTWDGTKNAINLVSNKPYTVTGGELSKGDGKAKTANLTTSTIYKDGKVIDLLAYTINGNNYFKLRDVAQAFDIGVIWDGTTNTIIIDTNIGYTP